MVIVKPGLEDEAAAAAGLGESEESEPDTRG